MPANNIVYRNTVGISDVFSAMTKSATTIIKFKSLKYLLQAKGACSNNNVTENDWKKGISLLTVTQHFTR